MASGTPSQSSIGLYVWTKARVLFFTVKFWVCIMCFVSLIVPVSYTKPNYSLLIILCYFIFSSLTHLFAFYKTGL